jgi:hypothetical protein
MFLSFLGHFALERGGNVHRKLARLIGCLLTVGGVWLATSSARADYQYASFYVYDSSHKVIAADSLTISYATAIANGSGYIYDIPNSTLANPLYYGDATALSLGGSAAGPYYDIFGVDFDGTNYYLAFTWDPTGNDPYGSFANTFDSYIEPPGQPSYSYSATQYLNPTLIAAGDTAAFVLSVPEPASMALLATGGLALAGFTRLRRKRAVR